MQVQDRITPAVLAAAAGLLQPYVPELSPKSLVAALKAYGDAGRASSAPERLLTRKEAADQLHVTLATLNRMLNDGRLRRIRVTTGSVRLDPADIRNLLRDGGMR